MSSLHSPTLATRSHPDQPPAGGPEGEGPLGDGSTAGSRAAARWRRWRLPLAGLAVAVGVAVLGVLALPRTGAGALDPTSPSPDGSRALAQVLGDRGVDVQRVATVAGAVDAAGPGSTLVVVDPDLLPPDLVTDLARAGSDLVLVEPDGTTLAATEAALVPAGTAPDDVAEPGCDVPAAVAAGRAASGGHLYRTSTGADGTQVCFRASDGPGDAGQDGGNGSYAVWAGDGRRVTVIGQSRVLTNERLADEGNAALALRSLGGQERLVWLMSGPLEGATDEAEDPTALLPRWVGWVALQLALVAVLAIVWRARRLGRLVAEPLPVVVRAAETALGRASLYRRAGARNRAASVLRAASLRRVAARVGLSPSASGPEVVEAAAAAAGRATADVHHLVLGPPPADDRALTTLADDLDTLERDVSRQ